MVLQSQISFTTGQPSEPNAITSGKLPHLEISLALHSSP